MCGTRLLCIHSVLLTIFVQSESVLKLNNISNTPSLLNNTLFRVKANKINTMRHGIEDPKEQVLPVFLPRCVVLVPEGQDLLF